MFDTRRVVIALASLALLALGWFYVAPAPIGQTAYVTTFGNSMEPRIHKGDLIAVRPVAEYRVGDAIAYRSGVLKEIVFHRVVAVDGDHFVTKGDHNTWLDEDKPTKNEILGKEALHLAGAGSILHDLQRPAFFSLFAGTAVFAYRRIEKSRRPFRRQKMFPGLTKPQRSEAGEVNPWIVLTVGAGCLVLAAVSFTRPTNNETSRDVTLNHRGEFSYSAVVPNAGAVYLDGRLKTGDPVYLRLLNRVDISFTYRLESTAKLESQGTMELYAEVRDTSGWARRTTLQPSTPMTISTDAPSTVSGSLDIGGLIDMTDKLESMTGLARDSYTVVIKSSVRLDGDVDGHVVQEAFEPELTFSLDNLQLQLQVTSGKAQDALKPSGGGLLQMPTKHTNTLFGVPVMFLRSAGVLGMFATLVFALPFLTRMRRRPEMSEAERIRSKHAKLLLPVTSFQVNVNGRVHETTSFESLVRLAELHDQVIYCWEHPNGSTYVVEHEGVVHRYASGDPGPIAEQEAPGAEDVA